MEVRARRFLGTALGAASVRDGFARNRAALGDGIARRLVFSEFASMLGDFVVLAAMPFAVFAVGGSAQQVGFVLAAQGVGVVAALPIAGVYGDRFDRRSVMIAADLVRFVSQGLIALLLLAGSASVETLVLAQLVHGLAQGFFQPASAAIVPDVIGDESVQPTFGLKTVARGAAGSVGPALGAVAVALVGPGLAIAADAGTFVISAVALAGVPRRARSIEDVEHGSPFGDFFEGLRAFLGRRWLRSITIEFFFVNALVVCPLFVLGPVVAEDSLGGIDAWALLLVGLAVGQVLGGLVGGIVQPERPLVAATTAFAFWSVPLILLAVGSPMALLVVGMFVGGVTEAFFDVLWRTTVQTQVPSSERSRINSIEEGASLASVPLGFLLGGWLESSIGTTAALLGGAAVLCGASVLVLALPSVRSLRAVRPGPATELLEKGVPTISRGGESTAARKTKVGGSIQ